MVTIYLLQIQRRGIDGWGRDTALHTELLAVFDTWEKAKAAKVEYDESLDGRDMFDVGDTWIVERPVE